MQRAHPRDALICTGQEVFSPTADSRHQTADEPRAENGGCRRGSLTITISSSSSSRIGSANLNSRSPSPVKVQMVNGCRAAAATAAIRHCRRRRPPISSIWRLQLTPESNFIHLKASTAAGCSAFKACAFDCQDARSPASHSRLHLTRLHPTSS